MRTVFFDVDTQIDFLFPAGALYVPGAERILAAVAGLNQYAARHSIPVVSTVDAHAEDDAEFRDWPAHCVAGTAGQRKPQETLIEPRVVIPNAPGDYSIDQARQIVIEKQALDCFTNPNLRGLLERLAADRYVVYGLVTEFCVRCAALGLLGTGRRVELVTDAVQGLRQEEAQRTCEEFTAAGGLLTRLAQVCA